MDLTNIEGWSRRLLESEAHKRGLKNPQVYTQGELVRIILRYEAQERRAPSGLRAAALRVASGLASAKGAIGRLRRMGKRPAGAGARVSERARDEPREILAQAPTAPDWPQEQSRAVAPAARPELAAVGGERAQADVATAERSQAVTPSPRNDETNPLRGLVAASVRDEETASAQPAPSERRAVAGVADGARSGAYTFARDDAQQISYDTRSTDGLHLRWLVTDAGLARARAVLGAPGELAVRVVAVRVETGARVRTEITDHGPVAASGDWLAPLEPGAARYVSSIGLRHGERFVSIAHRTA